MGPAGSWSAVRVSSGSVAIRRARSRAAGVAAAADVGRGSGEEGGLLAKEVGDIAGIPVPEFGRDPPRLGITPPGLGAGVGFGGKPGVGGEPGGGAGLFGPNGAPSSGGGGGMSGFASPSVAVGCGAGAGLTAGDSYFGPSSSNFR